MGISRQSRAPAGFFRLVAVPAAVALVSGGALYVFHRHALIESDTCRDLLVARDLLEGRRLHLAGVWTSMLEMRQGGLFPSLMALGYRVGRPVSAVRGAMMGLFVLSVLALFLGARRRLGTHAAWVAAGLWLAFGPIAVCFIALDNPNLLALPVVLFALALFDLTHDGGPLSAAAAGAVWGLAVLSHISALMLGPAVLLAVLWGRRPWVALPVLVAAFAATMLVLSPGTLYRDVGTLLTVYLGVTGATAASVVAAGAVGRRWLRRFTPQARSRIVLGIAVASFAVSLGVLDATGHRLFWYYAAPAVPEAVWLFADLVQSIGRVKLTAGLLVVSAFLVVEMRQTAPANQAMSAVPAILHRFEELGYGPEALRLRLRSPLRRTLLACAVALDETATRPVPAADLVFIPSDPGRPPPDARRSIAIAGLEAYQIKPWLDQERPRLCLTARKTRRCQDLSWEAKALAAGAPLADEAYPTIAGADALVREMPPALDRATVALPLRVSAPGGTRTLVVLTPPPPEGGCGFRIERVDGARVQTQLPAAEAVIDAAPGAVGRVVLGVTFNRQQRGCPNLDVPPSVAEIPGTFP